MQINSKDQQGLLKFIQLMRNLTNLLIEDNTHQLTIYSCLNSQELNSLFHSLHDHDFQLRVTAAKFVCLLLQNNPRILELIGVVQGYGPSKEPRKYVIGGLQAYQMNSSQLRRKFGIKQLEVVGSLRQVAVEPGAIAWAVELKTGKTAFFGGSRTQLDEPFPFDPNHWVIGVFVGGETESEDKKDKGRYKISKK